MSLSCANNREFCVSNSSDLRTIADVCIKVTSGGTPRRSTATFYEDGIWPWVKTKELVDGWLNHTEEYITEVAVAASSAKILPEDTILMAMYGATVGKLGILSRPMACNQACCAMIVDPQEADFRYLFYQLQYVRPQIKGLATGAAQQNLSMELIKSLQFAFPSLPRQEKIADCLGSLDDLIMANRRKLEALRRQKQGLMQQLFPRSGETVPRLRFPEFRDTGEWETGTLGEVGEFISGGTPSTLIPEYWGGNIQWFTPSEINERNLSKSKRTITCEGLKHSSARLLPTGALLITTRATIGDVGIAENTCATNQGFHSLVVFEREVNIFWYYWLVQHKHELIRRSSGSTFLEIRKTGLKQIPIVRPNKDEQQKIADCLGSLDDMIAAEGRKLKALQRHKQGLMQQLFPRLETK